MPSAARRPFPVSRHHLCISVILVQVLFPVGVVHNSSVQPQPTPYIPKKWFVKVQNNMNPYEIHIQKSTPLVFLTANYAMVWNGLQQKPFFISISVKYIPEWVLNRPIQKEFWPSANSFSCSWTKVCSSGSAMLARTPPWKSIHPSKKHPSL